MIDLLLVIVYRVIYTQYNINGTLPGWTGRHHPLQAHRFILLTSLPLLFHSMLSLSVRNFGFSAVLSHFNRRLCYVWSSCFIGDVGGSSFTANAFVSHRRRTSYCWNFCHRHYALSLISRISSYLEYSH